MRRLLLFTFYILIPAVIVGISNWHVFPDSFLPATLMLVVTAGVAGCFTWLSGDATPATALYAKCADFIIAAILCLNLAGHWILAREVSAAKQGVVERHDEEDRQDKRAEAETERQLKLKKADADLARAEARRLAQLPVSQRRAQAPKPEPTKPPTIQPLSLVPEGSATASMSAPIAIPKKTPEQVRES
jgi:hypothetical protein